MSESEIRVGDRFLVECEVIDRDNSDNYFVVRSSRSHLNSMSRETLLAAKRIEPALRVGDKVFRGFASWVAVIVAIDGKFAWYRYDDGSQNIAPISELERAP